MRGWQFDMTAPDSYAGYFATPKWKPAAAFLLLDLFADDVRGDQRWGGGGELGDPVEGGERHHRLWVCIPPIATVRLRLVRVGGALAGDTPCANQAQCDFPCPRQTGSTPFNIPETRGTEKYEVSVVAVGADGSELPEVLTPAPILREVVRVSRPR